MTSTVQPRVLYNVGLVILIIMCLSASEYPLLDQVQDTSCWVWLKTQTWGRTKRACLFPAPRPWECHITLQDSLSLL